jgi:hypothetical protein
MAQQEITLPSGTKISIDAPGLDVRQPVAKAEANAALSAMAPGPADRWSEAIAANDLDMADAEALPVTFEAQAAAPKMILARSGIAEPHVEIAVHPKPDHTALLMVQHGNVVQWFFPVNAPRVVPRHVGLRALTADAVPQQPLRFVVPASVLHPIAPAQNTKALSFSVGSIVSRIVHVPIIRDLLDAPIRWIVQFLAEKVEAKEKREGFKLFDDAGQFPLLTDQQIADMAKDGKRVLFLTHGIFSSIGGAFSDLLNTPALAKLRQTYADRIIGWDHFTVSKTPLENADEMLTKMAPAMNVDFICHSRGALVMRAALEHPSLITKSSTRFLDRSVGSAMFVAGANQGSQLASFTHLNTLLNVYSAIGSILPGIALKVIVGVLRVLAHGVTTLPSVEALSSDASNEFVNALNGAPRMSLKGRLAVAHANFDPKGSILGAIANLNIDTIFGTANDLVVPFAGAATFDPNVIADQEKAFGSLMVPQSEVLHTNFFAQDPVRSFIADTFV